MMRETGASHTHTTLRININGDLDVPTHGTKKNQKKQDSFYPFLSTLHMASPTLSQALSSPLWLRHTPRIRSY